MGGSTKLMSSGAGGVILTTPGSIAADVTVNLPTQNSTLAINGPAFSAYKSTDQSLTTSTSTKITFDTEDYDTANCFSGSRFTPNVAGYYQLNASIALNANPFTVALWEFQKNNSISLRQAQLTVASGASTTEYMTTGSCIVYFNGTTDYAEIYGYVAGTTPGCRGFTGGLLTKFSGSLVRAA